MWHPQSPPPPPEEGGEGSTETDSPPFPQNREVSWVTGRGLGQAVPYRAGISPWGFPLAYLYP